MNEVEVVVIADDRTGDGFDRAQRRAQGFEAVISKIGQSIGSLLSGGVSKAVDFGSEAFQNFFRNTSNAAQSMAASVATAITTGVSTTAATGGINLLVGALLAAASAAAIAATGFVVLAPAVLLVGGAMGSAATAVVGLAGSFAVFKLGLGGISDAWSAYGESAASGGESSEAAAERVRSATRQLQTATESLSRAQRDAADAQRDVTQAREEELERQQDLAMSAARAKLDERAAVLALAEAEEKLSNIKKLPDGFKFLRGDDNEAARAQLEYDQAEQTLAEIRERLGDIGEEQQDASRKGVDGSDAVQDALRRQEDAQLAVVQAQRSLADAQAALNQETDSGTSSVDAYAEAMAKLSPNARRLVETLNGLRGKFDDLRKSVQDRLLAGFDESVEQLASRWLPALEPMLGNLADSFNFVGRSMMDAFGKPEFIANIDTAMGGVGNVVDRIGKSMPGLIDAFGRVAAASVPFLEEIGDLLGDAADKFSAWIESADESGALSSFMEDAAAALRDILDIGGLALGIIGDIVEILFPGSQRTSDGVLDGVKGFLEDIREWLGESENQEKLRDFVDKMIDFGETLATVVIPAVIDFVSWLVRMGERIGEWKEAIGDATGYISDKFDSLVSKVSGLGSRISRAAGGMWDGIKNAFRSAINWVIDRWNGIEFSMPGFSFMGVDVGGWSMGMAQIPRLAQGGVAGGMALVGERGRELVRLPQGSQVIPNGTTEAMLAGGSSNVHFVLEASGSNDREFIDWMLGRVRFKIRTEGGGNVQNYLGGGI